MIEWAEVELAWQAHGHLEFRSRGRIQPGMEGGSA